MLDCSKMTPEGILVLKPRGPLKEEDFGGMAESPGEHFASAAVRHFPFSEDARVLDWLKTA